MKNKRNSTKMNRHFIPSDRPNHPADSCTGTIIKKITGGFVVQADHQAVDCTLASTLRQQVSQRLVDLTVGDRVQFTQQFNGSGSIHTLLPRRSSLSRRTAVPMPGAHAFEQVIVANVDQVVPVFAAAQPKPSWNMLDRYLVSAESAGLPAVICITKLDLAYDVTGEMDAELEATLADYRQIGYPVILTSTATGNGIQELSEQLAGKVSVFLGKSGVGKTSLLNALQPGLGERVGAVNQRTGKGKHTTTHLELFPFDGDGAIIDTPGVREFGLWDIDEQDMVTFFPEMASWLGQCRFGMNCQHDNEPGCAIRAAVMQGLVSPRRYHSMLRLRQGD